VRKLAGKPRLATAGLAGDQGNAASLALGLRKEGAQRSKLVRAPDEGEGRCETKRTGKMDRSATSRGS
jgi:hypothetical protein